VREQEANNKELVFMFKFKLLLFVLGLFALSVAPLAAQEEITLVVWDTFSRDVESALMETLGDQFEATHPGVTVEHQGYLFQDLQAVLPLSLSEDGGPDVAAVNQAKIAMGALVEAGLLVPLNDYADQYDWWSLYGDVLHARNTYSADGQTYGEGNLYGVSNTAEVVGVYYWRSAFDELGLEIPQTFEEYEAMLQTIKDAGKIPIAFGSLDGWPAIHQYSSIQHPLSTVQAIDDFIFRREGGTFVDDANLLAAQKLVEWADAGYFPDGFEGLSYDNNDLLNIFLSGDAVTWTTGSWIASTLVDQAGEEEIGFFVIPPANADNPPYAIGGVGIPYGISARSAHPDLAAEFIDLISSPEVAAQLLSLGFLPSATVDPSALIEGTLTADVVNGWNLISSSNAVGHYLDWAVPLDDINASLQELLGKQITPEEFVAQMEEAYEDAA
jgi:raffinose/stachyose/melibiose transport system substrate-binding protein